MKPQYRYFEDPLKLEFEAQVVEAVELGQGQFGVVLDQTYFYPTGGGQEHDTGFLDEIAVVDVQREDSTERVVHILEREPSPGLVTANIDQERRQRNMQHHTAQHLLSACFQQRYDLETLSANINGYRPSTIDLPETTLDVEMLATIETQAAEIIFENRRVKTYFVEQDHLQTVPLRRPPKVLGEVRVVKIDGFDYSACGGTHCLSSGMIGTVKILKSEHLSKRSRIHFVAGYQALEVFHTAQQAVSTLAEEMSIHPDDLVTTVRKHAQSLKETQRELRILRKERLHLEAQEMVTNAREVNEYNLVIGSYHSRPVDELQGLAKLLIGSDAIVATLATYDDQKITLVTACSEDAGVHAGNLANQLLSQIDGRGGGGPQIAQGGGRASEQQFHSFFENIENLI